MDSIVRARHVRDNMNRYDGGDRRVYWDRTHKCFRVLASNSHSFWRFGRQNFDLVD